MKFLIISISFLLSGMSSSFNLLEDYTGSWEYTVDTPEGTINGTLVLDKNDEGYIGHIESDGAKIPLKDLKVEGSDMSFNIVVDGYSVAITGDFEGDKLSMEASVEGMVIPFVANRKE